MFDFLGGQILSLVAARRVANSENLLLETRRLAELEPSKTPAAQAAVTEDQVFLSGAAPLPSAPTPIKPNEPVETGNRVRDVLRRLRESRRKPRRGSSSSARDSHEETPDSPSGGHRLDRWA